MTLKKSDIIEMLNSEIGLTKAESKLLVNDFFEAIMSSLESGKKVSIRKFGTFKLLNKNERLGRNPKTGQPHTITARKVVTFKANKLTHTAMTGYDK